MARLWISLRIILPAVWIGLVVGLAFIETPLKFTAPGITVPLALGVGRIVFTALSVAGWILLVVIALVGLARPRETRSGWILIAGLAVVLVFESFVIRSQLAARTDIVIAGGDPGPSWLHYGYIVAELVLLALLVAYVAHSARRIRIKSA